MLAVHGLASVLAARHILVLRGAGPAQPSGPGDPELHILGGRRQVITTDGRGYHFAGCRRHPAGAARLILPADMLAGDMKRQLPPPADRGAGGPDRVMGAGERALRRLCEVGVI